MAAIIEPQYDLRGQGHRVFYGSAPPVAASDLVGLVANVGDVIINIAPVPGGPVQWACTTAGTVTVPQGVWTSQGAIGALSMAVTNAQVLTLFSAPTLVLAAQGAGT